MVIYIYQNKGSETSFSHTLSWGFTIVSKGWDRALLFLSNYYHLVISEDFIKVDGKQGSIEELK